MEELAVKSEGQQAVRDDLVADNDNWWWRGSEVAGPPWFARPAHERHLEVLHLVFRPEGSPGVGGKDEGTELRRCFRKTPE
jgi:hypothetical protein